MENVKLAKTEDNKIIAGVCGGLAKYLGIDSSIFRIAFALCTILGIGSPILIYIVLAIIMPKENPYLFE